MADSFGDYLAEISRHPLLKPAEEIELGRLIQRGLQAEQSANPSAQDRRAVKAGRKALNRMIVANLRLVVNIATLYKRRNPDLEIQDLIQEGSISLKRAAERFDHERGYKFSTFAYWWIRQGITKYIGENRGTIRIPNHVSDSIARIARAQERHFKETGSVKHEEVLASELKINYDILMSARLANCLSLDHVVAANDDPAPFLWLIPDDQNLWDNAEASESVDLAQKMLSLLSSRDRQIVELHLLENLEFSQIACKLGMASRGSAHYFYTKAIQFLRDASNTLQQELVLS